MKRKLIQHGASSLTVVLPRKWVKQHGVKKGDEIEVEEVSNKLLLSTDQYALPERVKIDVSHAGSMIKRIVAAAVKAGYTEIEVTFDSYEELRTIQEFVRNVLSNFTLTHQTKNTAILKSLYKDSYGEYHSALRRYFLLMNHMADEIAHAFAKNDFEWIKRTVLIKTDLNRLSDYCRRAINMGFDIQFKRPGPLYTVVEELINTAAVYRDLCEYIVVQKIKSNEDTIRFLQLLARYQEDVYHLFYNFSIKEVVFFGNKKEELQVELATLAEKVSKKEIRLLGFFEKALFLIFQLGGPIATLYL